MAQSPLNQAISLIKSGDKPAARQILLDLVKADPTDQDAWLWMARAVDTARQQRECLEHVLVLNPDHEMAKLALEKMDKKGLDPPPRPVKYRTKTPPTPAPPPLPPVSDTKECPYCAEIIKTAAKVCRFCGRELNTGASIDRANNRALMGEAITRFTRHEWQIISQTETSVQLRKPKRWSVGLLVLGAITIVFFGFGLIFWILAVIDYAIKKDQVIFFDIDNITSDKLPSPTGSFSAINLIVVILLLVLAAMCAGYINVPI